MPISAAGMSTEARRPAAGYTLLEVMIVVTIIGLLSALAVLRLPGSDAPARALAAAGRLALGFAELRDEARLTGMARGMGCQAQLCQGFRPDDSGRHWQPLSGPGGEPLRIVLEEGLTVAFDPRLSPEAPAPAADAGPQLLYLPSGEATPFVLNLQAGGRVQARLSGDALGRLQTEAVPP